MNCDRMTNFPSCVARRLLFHLILNCDHNTTLSSYEAHICVNTCTKSEEMKRSNTTEPLLSQVWSSKSGSGSILLYYESKSRRAQSSVQISINYSRRYNYARESHERDISGIAAKIDDRSCSPAIISINAEKTQPVKKTSNRKRDRKPSRISVRRVTKLLRRKKSRSRVKNLLKHNCEAPHLSVIFLAITRNGLFGITVNIISVNTFFFINKQKEKKGCKYCTDKQADFSINMLQTKSNFSHHRVDHIFHVVSI